jgi:hypothetical protein
VFVERSGFVVLLLVSIELRLIEECPGELVALIAEDKLAGPHHAIINVPHVLSAAVSQGIKSRKLVQLLEQRRVLRGVRLGLERQEARVQFRGAIRVAGGELRGRQIRHHQRFQSRTRIGFRMHGLERLVQEFVGFVPLFLIESDTAETVEADRFGSAV